MLASLLNGKYLRILNGFSITKTVHGIMLVAVINEITKHMTASYKHSTCKRKWFKQELPKDFQSFEN